MSVLEIWGAEYQENDCLLIKPEDRGVLEAICGRERCSMQVPRRRPLQLSRCCASTAVPVHRAPGPSGLRGHREERRIFQLDESKSWAAVSKRSSPQESSCGRAWRAAGVHACGAAPPPPRLILPTA